MLQRQDMLVFACIQLVALFWLLADTRRARVQEVPAAVKQCQLAGIKVRMITGDNVLTARSIAAEIGILTDGEAIEGSEFRKMTPEQQRDVLKTMQVMARCSPQDKLTMVRRLKEMGEVRGAFFVSFGASFLVPPHFFIRCHGSFCSYLGLSDVSMELVRLLSSRSV